MTLAIFPAHRKNLNMPRKNNKIKPQTENLIQSYVIDTYSQTELGSIVLDEISKSIFSISSMYNSIYEYVVRTNALNPNQIKILYFIQYRFHKIYIYLNTVHKSMYLKEEYRYNSFLYYLPYIFISFISYNRGTTEII